jgi:hypothetical protein
MTNKASGIPHVIISMLIIISSDATRPLLSKQDANVTKQWDTMVYCVKTKIVIVPLSHTGGLICAACVDFILCDFSGEEKGKVSAF